MANVLAQSSKLELFGTREALNLVLEDVRKTVC